MEQLNRGVQVEHLSLPPGITLTKIDPSKAEALRAKTESIGKLSKPIEQVVNTNPGHSPYYQHIIAGGYNQPSVDQSGIIMVDAMGAKQSQYSAATAPSVLGDKMSKNKKKKNKKKSTVGISSSSNIQPQTNPAAPQMVTLKNPMFHGQFAQNPTTNNFSQSQVQGHMKNNGGGVAAASAGEQPAKIIKNDNGMFTIRRSGPELGMNYQSSTNGPVMNSAVPNYSHFTPKYYPTPSNSDSYSHFGTNYYNGQTEESDYRPTRCISAIGSEVKSAQQQKKSQEWIGTDKCCSSNTSNNSCGGGNSGGGYPASTFFNGFDSFPSTSTHSSASSHSYLPAPSNCGSLFDDAMAHHHCDDSPPPPISHEYKPYLEGIPNTGVISYNDASILKHLMPGQKLNNEVGFWLFVLDFFLMILDSCRCQFTI